MTEMVAVGIDVAKAKFDVALLLGERYRNKVFANTPAGFAQFLGWLRTLTPDTRSVHACMEATGRYGEDLALYLVEAGLRVSVVNPLLVAHYARALNRRSKNDRLDARTLAQFCRERTPALWQAPAPELRALRELVRRLDALLGLQRQELNRLESAGAPTRASIEAVLGVLDAQVREVKNAIASHIDRHPGLKSQAHLLDSIPGVGAATIALVLGELPPEVLSCVRRAAAFSGLQPHQFESGTIKKPTRLSKRGSARIRKGLYFPAIVACRHNAVVKAFYERMLQNGLTKKQAVCAAMRKLLHLIVGVLKSGKPFDPSLHNFKTA